MTNHHLNNEKAKTEVKAANAKDKVVRALQDDSSLKTRADLKGFWRQYPKACALFGQIVIVGRSSTARRPGVPGCWAAYTYPWWSKKTGLSVSTLKRQLDLLESHGLIERQLGKHGGTRVITYIRPTALALDLSDGRPGDRFHFGLKEGGQVEKTTGKPPSKPPVKQLEPEEPRPKTWDELMAILKA